MIRLSAASFTASRPAVAALLLLACLAVAGCGQKGDLYIPDMDPDEEVQLEDHF